MEGGNTATFHATLTLDSYVEIDGKVVPQFIAEDVTSFWGATEESKNTGNDAVITLPVTVINNTGVDIYRLYASSVETDDWEEDILAEDILYAGESYLINFTFDADTLDWDFAMEDSVGTVIEFYGLNFSDCNADGATLTLEYDGEYGHATLK